MNTHNKFLLLLMTVCLTGAIGNAFGAGLDSRDEAVLVPYVFYSSDSFTTAVGVTNRAAGTLFWSFFDTNGNRLANGTKTMAANRRLPFIWSTEATAAVAGGLANVPGYLVFAIDINGNNTIEVEDGGLTAGAFLINRNARDVAYIPTVPVDATFLSNSNPANWASNPVLALDTSYAAPTGQQVGMAYLIDGTPDNGEDTRFYIFTTQSPGPSQPMTVHDGDGGRASVTVPTTASHLNIVNPETISGISGGFLGDGSLRWSVPAAPGGAPLRTFVFSLIESTAFGAAQTLMGDF